MGIRKPEPFQVKGLNGKGAIPIGGVLVGASVFGVINLSTGSNDNANFESTISVFGQIQQTSTANLSGNEYYIYVVG
jgi:hypothetical protein